eukprot:10414729-Ditylum_brightwellii.AAC.1
MAMFLYALGVLPIISQLKHHQMDAESLAHIVEQLQAWYTDDSAKVGYFEAIQEWLSLSRWPYWGRKGGLRDEESIGVG